MKLTGMTTEEVDAAVDGFTKLMLSGMKKVVKTASLSMTAGIVAGAGEVIYAIDSLGVMQKQWQVYADDVLKPELQKLAVEAGKTVASPLGVDVPSVKTTQFLESMNGWVADFAGDMWQTSKDAIIAGSQDGESIAQLAARVENVAEVKAKKAHAIAQTAVIAAINGGEWQQMMELASAADLNGTKEWLATEDNHTRPAHHAADGQTVPIDGHFVVGGEFMLFPGDPSASAGEVANCRCTVAYNLDVEDQIIASQTSLGPQFDWSAVTADGQENAFLAALTAAFNELEHPRGNDGKFIKKGTGLGHHVFDALVKFKKHETVNSMSETEVVEFLNDALSVTPAQWKNLKNDDKELLMYNADSAVNLGYHKAAKALTHLEDVDANTGGSGNYSLDDDEQHPDLFDPGTPLPDFEPDDTSDFLDEPLLIEGQDDELNNETAKNVMASYYNKKIDTKTKDKLLDDIYIKNNPKGAQDVLDKANAPGLPYVNEGSSANDAANAPLTTGSSTPVKITHGLIHAKHTPGETVAQTTTGTHLVWNGDSYDIITPGNKNDVKGIKKSKLYAHINEKMGSASWVKPGKQETEVSHANHLDAAPPAEPIPHPVATPSVSSVVNDMIGENWTGAENQLNQVPVSTGSSTPLGGWAAWKKVKGSGIPMYSPDGKYKLSYGPNGPQLSKKSDTTGNWQFPVAVADNKMPHGVKWITNDPGAVNVPAPTIDSDPNKLYKNGIGALTQVVNGETLYSQNGKYKFAIDPLDNEPTMWKKNAAGEWDDPKAYSHSNIPQNAFFKKDPNAWTAQKMLEEKQKQGIVTSAPTASPPVTGTPVADLEQQKTNILKKFDDALAVGEIDADSHAAMTSTIAKTKAKYVKADQWEATLAAEKAKNAPSSVYGNPVAALNEGYFSGSIDSSSYEKLAGDLADGKLTGKEVNEKVAALKMLDEQYKKGLMTSDELKEQTDLVVGGVPPHDLAIIQQKDDLKAKINAAHAAGTIGHNDKYGMLIDAENATTSEQLIALSNSLDATPLDTTAMHYEAFKQSPISVTTPYATGTSELGTSWEFYKADDNSIGMLQAGENKKYMTHTSFEDLEAKMSFLGMTNVKTTKAMPGLSAPTPLPAPVNPLGAGPAVATADTLPSVKTKALYAHFKDEKVSPAWSAAKIYKSMHVAKAKMGGDPQIAAMPDSELLKVLDNEEMYKSGKVDAYSAKVKEWLKTPNGKKAFQELNPAITTPAPASSPGPATTAFNAAKSAAAKKTFGKSAFGAKKVGTAAKKAAPAAPIAPISAADALGTEDATMISESLMNDTYQKFKSASHGTYLTSSPEEVYWNVTKIIKNNLSLNHASPGQILAAVDKAGAKKFGVADEKKFTAKIKDWLATPAGQQKAAEIKAGKWSPSAGASYATGMYGGSSSYAHPVDTPLNEKIPPLNQHVEEYDSSKGYNWANKYTGDFPVINDAKSKEMVAEWSADQGAMTSAQKSALRKYTGSNFTPMNNYLRGYTGATEQTHKDVQTAQAGMRLSLEPIVLHRGNGWFQGWNSVAEVKSHLGEDFHQEAFFSASIGGKSGFSGAINFVIECPPGTPMAYVNTFSQHPSEDEMLLGGNLTYKVVEVIEGNKAPDGSNHHNTKVTVRLRVIPPSENQISYGSSA